jgi:serine/threonine-protein kinase
MEGTLLAGRYRLGARIGSGGMGTVWDATDERLRRSVAVKTLNPPSGDADEDVSAQRFEREAVAAASLSSRHIVTVHDYGKEEVHARRVMFLVMEKLPGRSLDRMLDGTRVDVTQIRDWARDICRALEAAHGAEIVHRDLKPANVMIGEDGRAVVLDFGIARFTGATDLTTLTATDGTVGTPAYMSPEQARGDRVLDARSDLYALGCLIYALLTGRPPFIGDAWHVVLLKHLEERPAPPSTYRPGLRPEWDALVMDLLAKEPGRRPIDAPTVAARLALIPDVAPPAPPRRPLGGGSGSGRARQLAQAMTVTATVKGAARPAVSEAKDTETGPAEPSERVELAPSVAIGLIALVDGLLAWLMMADLRHASVGWSVSIGLMVAAVVALLCRGLMRLSEQNRNSSIVTAVVSIPLVAAVAATALAELPWWTALLGIPAAFVYFWAAIYLGVYTVILGLPDAAGTSCAVFAQALGAAAVMLVAAENGVWLQALLEMLFVWIMGTAVPGLLAGLCLFTLRRFRH